MRRAIFLDRDGTLNRDHGYVHLFAEWEWLPGAMAALAMFAHAGWELVVITNQSGIGRKYYGHEDVHRLHTAVNEHLLHSGIHIAGWYYCPHLPGDNCQCRKPRPGLLFQAARELDISLAQSWMIGDRFHDAQAGLQAGCHSGLLTADNNNADAVLARSVPQISIWPSLLAAAHSITSLPDATEHANV